MARAADYTSIIGADISDFEDSLLRAERRAQAFGARVQRLMSGQAPPPRLETVSLYREQGARAGRGFSDGLLEGLSSRDPFLALSRNAGSAAAAVGLAFGAREAVQMADAWQNSANRLMLISENAGQAAAYHRQLYELSQQTRTETEATVQLFHRLSTSTENLPRGHKELLDVTRAVNQSFAISGATAQESAAAIQQFGQALASNRLGGEEFRSISEMAPRLRDAIADALDVNIGKLRQMAEAGQLTSSVVFGAITEMADEINAEFEIVETTISGAFQRLSNAAGRFVGETGQVTGATRALSESINFVADNFGELMNIAAAFATLLAARFGGRVFQGLAVSTRGVIDGFRAQREELIATTYARNIDAQVAKQAAVDDLRLTQQRITNLGKIEQGLQAAARAERGRIQQIYNITGGGTVDRTAQGTFRTNAERQRIQRALQRGNLDLEMSERRLIAIQNQMDATQRRLAQSTAHLTTARNAEKLATDAATAAGGRHAASLAAQRLGAQALTGAAALLKTAYAAIGGPVGLVILGVSSLVYWFQQQKIEAEQATRALEDWKVALEAMPQVEFDFQESKLMAELQAADAIVTEMERKTAGLERKPTNVWRKLINLTEINPNDRLFEQLDEAVVRADKARAAIEDYLEVGRKREEDHSVDNTGQADAELRGQIDRLARLRDIGEAQKQEYAEIEQVLAAHNEELRKLQEAAPELDDPTQRASNQLRRLEIQVDIRELTKETQWERDLKQRMDAAARAEEARIRALRDRAQDALTGLKISLDTQQADSVVNSYIQRVLASQREVTAEIARQGGWRRANVDLLQDEIDLLKAFDVSEVRIDLTVPKLLELTPVVVPGTLDRLLRTIQEQTDEIQMFDVFGNEDAERISRQSREASIRRLVDRLQEGKFQAAQIRDILEKAGLSTEDIDRAFGRMDRVDFSNIVNAGRGLLQIADSAGRVSEEFRKIADGALGILSGIQQIQEAVDAMEGAKSIGALFSSPEGISGMIAMVGGLVSVFDGLFSGGPTSLEIAIEKNRDALDRMRSALDRNFDQLGDNTAYIATLQSIFDRRREFDIDPPGMIQDAVQWDRILDSFKLAGDDNFDRIARELGTSLAEVEEAAQRFGVAIRDDEGNLFIQGILDLMDAMQLAKDEVLQLTKTFSGLRTLLEAERDLRNLEDPIDVWNNVVEMAGELLPPSLARAFDNLDISTVEGQQAARDFLIDLFENARAGNLTDMLESSGFEGIEEFIEFLLYAEDPLDNLADAADKAAEALRDINLPPGFRSEFSQWANTIPGLGEISPQNPIIVEQPVFNIPVTQVPPAPVPTPAPYNPEDLRPNISITIAPNAFTYTGASADEGYRRTRERVMAAARASENPLAAIEAVNAIFPEV